MLSDKMCSNFVKLFDTYMSARVPERYTQIINGHARHAESSANTDCSTGTTRTNIYVRTRSFVPVTFGFTCKKSSAAVAADVREGDRNNSRNSSSSGAHEASVIASLYAWRVNPPHP